MNHVELAWISPDSGKQKAKQRISEQNMGNRKQNKGFQNKTTDFGAKRRGRTESETKDFRTKCKKPKAIKGF